MKSPLKVSGITTSQAVFANTGQTVQLAVSMSEAVLLDPTEAVGVPTLLLNDGGTAFYDINASDLSAGLLVFDYKVGAHDSTTDLKVTALNQNGAAFFNSAGNVLDVATGFPFDVGIGINSFNRWKGGKVGGWSTASNWTSGIPASTTQAMILSGGVVSSTGADSPTVGSIATSKGATLVVAGGSFTATLGTGIGVNVGAIVVKDGATATLGGRFVNSGLIALSGSTSATRLELNGVVISGGKLQTSGTSALIETVSGTADAVKGATIASRSQVAVTDASTLTLSGGTVGSGATISATSGSTAVVSGIVTNAGTITLNGVTSVGATAMLQTLAGGTALLTGAVTNSGTLFASGAHSLIDIASGATVIGGGIAKIGNGVLDIEGSDDQNVLFLAGGSGTLQIADAAGNTSVFGGTVSGFGQNLHQFINLTSVHFVSGAINASYSSSTASSGVLTVTSGGTGNVIAVIDFSGHYVTSNFHITSGANGSVAIFDPPVIAQQTTLGFPDMLDAVEKIIGTVANNILAGKFALLGNYMASEFASVIGGHAGTLATEANQLAQQLLTHPKHG